MVTLLYRKSMSLIRTQLYPAFDVEEREGKGNFQGSKHEGMGMTILSLTTLSKVTVRRDPGMS